MGSRDHRNAGRGGCGMHDLSVVHRSRVTPGARAAAMKAGEVVVAQGLWVGREGWGCAGGRGQGRDKHQKKARGTPRCLDRHERDVAAPARPRAERYSFARWGRGLVVGGGEGGVVSAGIGSREYVQTKKKQKNCAPRRALCARSQGAQDCSGWSRLPAGYGQTGRLAWGRDVANRGARAPVVCRGLPAPPPPPPRTSGSASEAPLCTRTRFAPCPLH